MIVRYNDYKHTLRSLMAPGKQGLADYLIMHSHIPFSRAGLHDCERLLTGSRSFNPKLHWLFQLARICFQCGGGPAIATAVGKHSRVCHYFSRPMPPGMGHMFQTADTFLWNCAQPVHIGPGKAGRRDGHMKSKK